MLYRKLGKTDLNVSILGFGAMRLPMKNGSHGDLDSFDPNKSVDEEQTKEMIEYAIKNGVNYFDTGYMYHMGKSESILGKALKGYRDKIILATKLPMMIVKKREDIERFLDEQLAKLDTNYLDVYLLHGLDREAWKKTKDYDAFKFLDKVKSDGRVRYVGFSFHDNVNVFKEIVDGYDWTLAQIQYNYYDEHNQAGTEGLLYAASRGIGVIVMEPLRGGKLTYPVPDEIQAIWDTADVRRSPAEWGLRWVWNHPEVSCVLSGMCAMSQVIENIKLANDGIPNSLSQRELSIINQVKETYKKMIKIDCTACEYCMPCNAEVNIPTNFSMYNDTFVFKDNAESSVMAYNLFLPPEQRASNCIECGECEEVCPQHIKIRDELKNVHKALFRENMQRKQD